MSCAFPKHIKGVVNYRGELVDIPCGQCLSCRISKQKYLIYKAVHEYKYYSCGSFVTFTYDDLHLPFNCGAFIPTLRKSDLQKFIKSLQDYVRYHYNSLKFSYLACGEYGDSFKRPHYHVLFFGLDYQLFKKVFCSLWSYGSIKSLPISAGAIRYVSKYVTKSSSKNALQSEYFDKCVDVPFVLHSRGLGLQWIKDNIDEVRDFGQITSFENGKKVVQRLDNYYFNKFIRYDSGTLERQDYVHIDNENRLKKEALSSGYDDVVQYRLDSNYNREKIALHRVRNNLQELPYDEFNYL